MKEMFIVFSFLILLRVFLSLLLPPISLYATLLLLSIEPSCLWGTVNPWFACYGDKDREADG